MSEPSNIRINPFLGDGGTTTYINLTETHIIPSVSPYVIRLNEVPEKQDPSNIRAVWVDSSTGAVTASALTEVAATPAAGEFRPDYATKADGNDNWNTGLIEFSAVDAGKIVQISYTGMGTLAAVQSNKYPSWYTDRGDGSDGDFIPDADCTIGGIKNYKRVFIKAGVTVNVNKQLVMKATDSVVIAGSVKAVGGGGRGGQGEYNVIDNGESGEAGSGGGNGGAGTGDTLRGGGGGIGGLMLNYAGSGGGGGSGGAGRKGDSEQSDSYSSGANGGAGGAGINIIASTIDLLWGSIIESQGIAGGNKNLYAGGGVGGGGGGGSIAIIGNLVSNNGSVKSYGGAGGTKGSSRGANGENGTILIKQLGAL